MFLFYMQRHNIKNTIENKVKNTISQYKLITKNDRVFVAVSGGKDSTTVLHILHKLYPENTEAITIDVAIGNYSKENLENIKTFCRNNKIPLHITPFRKEFGCSLCYIRSALSANGVVLSSCALCGILKRYLLNLKSRELGATKLATGHNLDDEAHSILMNLARFDMQRLARLGPKAGLIMSEGFVQRIKPLYLCTEKEIIEYSKKMKFPVYYGKCPCSSGVFRRNVRDILFKAGVCDLRGVVNHFLKILPELKKNASSKGTLKFCAICGEPAKGKTCRACSIINAMKERSKDISETSS